LNQFSTNKEGNIIGLEYYKGTTGEVNQIQFIKNTICRNQPGFVLFVDGINNFTNLLAQLPLCGSTLSNIARGKAHEDQKSLNI